MKKKTLTIAIALVLVVALAVGATYALLTDKTESVTNTFAAGKIIGGDTVFTLKEHAIAGQNESGVYTLSETEYATNGNEYKAVVPGTVIPKDPTVKVEKLAGDAYLYIVVDDTLNAKLAHSIDVAWTKLGTNGTKTLYRIAANDGLVAANATVDRAILSGNELAAATDLGDGDLGKIAFQAYLVQAVGTTDAVKAWNASTYAAETGITAA